MPNFVPQEIPLSELEVYRPFQTSSGELFVATRITEHTITLSKMLKTNRLGQDRKLSVSEYNQKEVLTTNKRFYMMITEFTGSGVNYFKLI
jgi:hypothetical protein